MSKKRWVSLRREIIDRKVSRRRDTVAIRRHSREMEEKMSNSLNRVMSIPDKIADVEFKPTGKVISNYLVEKVDNKGNYRRFEFKNVVDYERWKAKNSDRYIANLKKRLTPHQFYITQSKGMERAFTGDYWWTNDVGRYDCVTCT